MGKGDICFKMSRGRRKKRSDTEKIVSGCLVGIFALLGVLIVGIVKLYKNGKNDRK